MSLHLLSRQPLSIIAPEVTIIRRDCYFRENIAEVREHMRLASRRQVPFSSIKAKKVD
jgi:hypothetical protein